MNFEAYMALSKKTLELTKNKDNSILSASDIMVLEQEIYDAKHQLEKYSKLFDISVSDFVEYFNSYIQTNPISGVGHIELRAEITSTDTHKFSSQFENKDDVLIEQDVYFDYVLYNEKGNRLAKLTDSCISMLANSKNLLYTKESASPVIISEQTQKNTKFNLVTGKGVFSVDSIFNYQLKPFSLRSNNITPKTAASINKAVWFVAQQNINKKRSEKLAKLDDEVNKLNNQQQVLQSGSLEAIR